MSRCRIGSIRVSAWYSRCETPLLITALYVAQRRRSTWPTIVAHLGLNGMETAGIITMVAGVIGPQALDPTKRRFR